MKLTEVLDSISFPTDSQFAELAARVSALEQGLPIPAPNPPPAPDPIPTPPSPPGGERLVADVDGLYRAANDRAAVVVISAGVYALDRPVEWLNDAAIKLEPQAFITRSVPFNPALFTFTNTYKNYSITGGVFDGAFGGRGIHASGYHCNVTMEDVLVTRCSRHMVDVSNAESFIAKNCHATFGLADSYEINNPTKHMDVHGFVTLGTKTVTLLGCTVDWVTGDSYQLDRGNNASVVLVENFEGKNSPLPEDYQVGVIQYDAGKRYGENGIDTKHRSVAQGAPLPPVSMTIRNSRFAGWKDSRVPVPAALNLKENVDFTIENVTVEDSFIAYRLRGQQDGIYLGEVNVNGGSVSGCEVDLRIEDAADQLRFSGVNWDRGVPLIKKFGKPSPDPVIN